jgi:NADH-quinone oxidoreductase subunit A
MGMEYLPVLILMAAGVGIGGAVLVLTTIFGPKLPNKMKDSPAECGVPIVEGQSQKKRVSVRFYLVAILFLLFDVETVFFYPWAVVYKKFLTTGNFILLEMLGFVAVLLVGYVYILRKGALDWE